MNETQDMQRLVMMLLKLRSGRVELRNRAGRHCGLSRNMHLAVTALNRVY